MKRLQQYLKDQDITQSAFALTMSVSQPTVSGWLNGAILPAAETLKEMSNKTGLSIDELLDHVPPRRASRSAALRKAV